MKNSPPQDSVRKNTQVLELEDIIEDEPGEREEEKSDDSMMEKWEQKNDQLSEIEVTAVAKSKNFISQSPPIGPTIYPNQSSNIKSHSSRTFSLFAMNLPISPPGSLESIQEDDATCCSRMICCPRVISHQDIHRRFFDQYWCLNYATIFKILANIMILVILWGWLILLFGDIAWPGGKLFNLLFISLIGYLIGWTLSYIPYLRLPPIVGMLLVGIVARRVIFQGKAFDKMTGNEETSKRSEMENDKVDLKTSFDDLGYTSAGNLRSFCLTFVMMRAGLQIDARKLARHRRAICRLGIIPGSVECIVVAIAAWNWLEVDINETIVKPLPFIYCLMTGAIVAVMSPVTAIHCALKLEEQGYSKAIATIIYTATSIDSVYMVSLFSLFYSFALRLWIDDSSTHTVKKSFQSTYALVAGALVGLSFGIILTFFPHRHSPYAFWFRVINLNLACIFCTCWGYSVSNIGAGLMGTCATCFVALTGWKIIDRGFKDAKRVRMITGILWHIAQPFLVVGIGIEIDFSHWTLERALWQICILAIGLLARCFSAIWIAHRHDINWNESIFLALAWTPKGHIQAAIGSLAYQTLLTLHDKDAIPNEESFEEEIKYAQVLMMISFMTVIIMGPLGSMLMMGLGPRLLTKHDHHLPIVSK